VTLKTPFYDSTSWHDTEYSVGQAIALGRFSGIRTVWLVEYATPSHADTYGVKQLESLGFTEKTRIHDYRSALIELSR
jgi:mannosyltransferase